VYVKNVSQTNRNRNQKQLNKIGETGMFDPATKSQTVDRKHPITHTLVNKVFKIN